MEQTRIDAIKARATTYDGKPCLHGHGGRRYAVSGRCVVCAREDAKRDAMRRKATIAALRDGSGND